MFNKIVLGIAKKYYDKLEGKKTYVIMTVGMIMAILDAWNGLCGEKIVASWYTDVSVPDWILAVLFGLGIYTRKVAKPK